MASREADEFLNLSAAEHTKSSHLTVQSHCTHSGIEHTNLLWEAELYRNETKIKILSHSGQTNKLISRWKLGGKWTKERTLRSIYIAKGAADSGKKRFFFGETSRGWAEKIFGYFGRWAHVVACRMGKLRWESAPMGLYCVSAWRWCSAVVRRKHFTK